MRTALVGLGEIGQHHLAAIRGSADAELVAICDLDGDLVKSSLGEGEAGHTELADMLAEHELDALDICLPHSLHLEAALTAFESGCHVVLEKPMALDVESSDRLSRAADEAGVRVAVSHNQLFFRPHQRLIECVRDGSLGSLQSIYARLWIADRYRGWRENPAIVGGGLLMDAGVHRVYLMRAIGGPVAAVTATMDAPRAEESFAVTFEFTSGATGVIQACYYAPSGIFDDRIDVVGAEGIASVAGCEAYFEGDLRDEPQLRVRINGEWRDEPVADSWESSLQASVRQALFALASGGSPAVDATAGRETVALIDAAYRAAETGTRVVTEDLMSDAGSRV